MRLFIACELPQEIVTSIKIIQHELQQKDLFQGTYPSLEQAHITLLFLGTINPETFPHLVDEFQQTDFRRPLFLQLSKLECDNKQHPRVLWIEIVSENLSFLVQNLEERLKKFIKSPEKRAFRPHITLARIKKCPDIRLFLEFISSYPVPQLTFEITHCILQESVLLFTGPEYTTRAMINLNQ
ncbi:MAG: RNA 2',3'-cyclic phosphodiesterase [Candidatus Babeliaceae bacterium]